MVPLQRIGRRGGADRGDRLSWISCESGVAPCAAALIRCQLPEPCATVRTAHNRHLLNDDIPELATGHRAVSSSATSLSFSPPRDRQRTSDRRSIRERRKASDHTDSNDRERM